MPSLQLIDLKCIHTEDIFGADEAYIQLDGKTIWGVEDINDHQTKSLGSVKPISFSGTSLLSLYDQDLPVDPDDLIGVEKVEESKLFKGPQNATLKYLTAHYVLHYEVILTPPPDGKTAQFPWSTEGYFGTDGYVWVVIDAGGNFTVTLKGKNSGVTGNSAHYSCSIIVLGYRDGKPDCILNVPTPQTLTVGIDSSSGTNTETETFTSFPPIKPEDLAGVRKVLVLYSYEKAGQNFKDTISDIIGATSQLIDEADALYEKAENSKIGGAIAVAAS